MDLKLKQQNDYEGNGWSKYQIMVLAQLEGHTKLLENLMNDLSDMNRAMAVSDNEYRNWQKNVDRELEDIDEKMNFILHDEKGVNSRLRTLEENGRIDEKSSLKLKALWGLIGGAIIILMDLVSKGFDLFKDHLSR